MVHQKMCIRDSIKCEIEFVEESHIQEKETAASQSGHLIQKTGTEVSQTAIQNANLNPRYTFDTFVAVSYTHLLPPHLRNWIITAFSPGMTTKYPLYGQPCTFHHTVLFQCLNGVLRTRRCVNTVNVYLHWG